MYAYGWFMLMYGRNQHNIVKQLSPNCCCCLVANSCPNLCNPIEHNTPGFPVLYYLRACAQTQVHWVSDAIQHLMSSPSPPWPQSFPASESFPISLLFPSGGQSVGASTSASASVLPMNVQGWLPLGLTGLISCCPRDSKSLPQHQNSKASILQHSAFLMVQLSHPYMTTGKTVALTRWTFADKVMSLLFNRLSRFVIAFLSRGKLPLLSPQWFWSPQKWILSLLQLFPLLFAMNW